MKLQVNSPYFSVLPVKGHPPSGSHSKAYLLSDDWNDWFKFQTLYFLVIFDAKGERHDIGGVKIGQFAMEEKQTRPNIPKTFDRLDGDFFSLGQQEDYYESLNQLGPELREYILASLHDISADSELCERILKEEVATESLLREVTLSTVRGQFRRMAGGGARLSRYKFTYEGPTPKKNVTPVSLSFEVKPESNPPTNIHVLIGRNGVGKTHHFDLMIRALLDANGTTKKDGKFLSEDRFQDGKLFANLVSVSFSAFDEFDPHPEQSGQDDVIGYSYIGLKRIQKTGKYSGTTKSPAMMENEFFKSVSLCFAGARKERWRKALESLEADPIFKEANASILIGKQGKPDFEKRSKKLFRKLSSGHKIVLLTITRLVEKVEERTLVLLDEPEAHLHPPLLSAFIRALSNLLIDRNGVAIIATHSPVVLQEVPKSCVWRIRRSGLVVKAERPGFETFGENVGILTREIFGLEVTHSGYHELLLEAIGKKKNYESAVAYFGNQLGAEGRAILRALIPDQEDVGEW